jgi:hypothetical protein
MKKKETNEELERVETRVGTEAGTKVRVRFINTYIGDLGVYYKNVPYELSREQYKVLKKDCKEIE